VHVLWFCCRVPVKLKRLVGAAPCSWTAKGRAEGHVARIPRRHFSRVGDRCLQAAGRRRELLSGLSNRLALAAAECFSSSPDPRLYLRAALAIRNLDLHPGGESRKLDRPQPTDTELTGCLLPCHRRFHSQETLTGVTASSARTPTSPTASGYSRWRFRTSARASRRPRRSGRRPTRKSASLSSGGLDQPKHRLMPCRCDPSSLRGIDDSRSS
jgi:hypothetical protein